MKTSACLSLVVLLCLPSSVPGQDTRREPTANEDASKKEREERAAQLAQLQEIYKIEDLKEKIERLEQYINEYPEGAHLWMAYSALFQVVQKEEPARIVGLAEQALNRTTAPRDPMLRLTAYRHLFQFFEEQKDEAAANGLRERILAGEEPQILFNIARSDKVGALDYYRRAIEKKEREPEERFSIFYERVYSTYAEELSRRNRHREAVENMSEAIQIGEKRVRELEALDEADPKKGELDFAKRRLMLGHTTMADLLKKQGDAKGGLEHLARAELLLASGGVDYRPRIVRLRAELYESLGDTEKAFENLLQLAAHQSDAAIWKKIEEISTATARSMKEVRAHVNRIRTAQAPVIVPFELKTVEGEPKSYWDLKGKVTLVNLFFPT